VDDINLQRLILWVETTCHDKGGEWIAIRPKIQTAPLIGRLGPVE